jgi:hypothetical protein
MSAHVCVCVCARVHVCFFSIIHRRKQYIVTSKKSLLFIVIVVKVAFLPGRVTRTPS